MKTCGSCGQEKSLDAFSPREAGKVGYYSVCRACKTDWARVWQREQKLKRHGVPEERIPALLVEAENGRCHACGGEPGEVRGPGSERRLHVDHDHQTNAYRGLLCKPCNTALGLVGDDVDRLMALAAYLLQSTDLLQESPRT